MKKLFFMYIILLTSNNLTAEPYVTENKIENLKYGYKLGDLITVHDKIITNEKFIANPELLTNENQYFKIINQVNKISKIDKKNVYSNEIVYQLFIQTKSSNYKIPTHQYKINDEKVSMPQLNFWFTRIAGSPINNVLTNSIDQKKPSVYLIEKQSFYFLSIFSIFILLILCYKNLDFSYLKKMNGPFAKAHRKIKNLHKKNHKDNYVEAILILTDAFNKTFKNNINNSNFNELINQNIKFMELKNEIKIFISVSSVEIYSSKTFFTKLRFDEIYNFTKVLRSVERKL